MTRYEMFLTKLADLMDEYGATIAAGEDNGSWHSHADGICIEFVRRNSDSIEKPDDGYKEIHLGVSNFDVDSAVIRKYLNEST